MSGYNYNDQVGCCNGFGGCNYHSLADMNVTRQLPACLNRGNRERSEKDKMYYDFYVLGKPVNIAPESSSEITDWNNMIAKSEFYRYARENKRNR